jgi:glyceraldehyde 3-phosphate dehydrogenase
MARVASGDWRCARSAMPSLAPTTTGRATSIALIYPELKGKLDGHAVRAPPGTGPPPGAA